MKQGWVLGLRFPRDRRLRRDLERRVPGRGSKCGGLGRVWPRGTWRTGGRAGSAGDTSLSRPSKTLATSEVTDGSSGETTPEQEEKPCSASTPCGSRPPPACIPHWGFSPLIYSYFSSQSGPSQALRTSWFSSGFSAVEGVSRNPRPLIETTVSPRWTCGLPLLGSDLQPLSWALGPRWVSGAEALWPWVQGKQHAAGPGSCLRPPVLTLRASEFLSFRGKGSCRCD